MSLPMPGFPRRPFASARSCYGPYPVPCPAAPDDEQGIREQVLGCAAREERAQRADHTVLRYSAADHFPRLQRLGDTYRTLKGDVAQSFTAARNNSVSLVASRKKTSGQYRSEVRALWNICF